MERTPRPFHGTQSLISFSIMPHQAIDVTFSLVPVDVTFSLSGTSSPWEATSRDNRRLMKPLDVDPLHTFSG